MALRLDTEHFRRNLLNFSWSIELYERFHIAKAFANSVFLKLNSNLCTVWCDFREHPETRLLTILNGRCIRLPFYSYFWCHLCKRDDFLKSFGHFKLSLNLKVYVGRRTTTLISASALILNCTFSSLVDWSWKWISLFSEKSRFKYCGLF